MNEQTMQFIATLNAIRQRLESIQGFLKAGQLTKARLVAGETVEDIEIHLARLSTDE